MLTIAPILLPLATALIALFMGGPSTLRRIIGASSLVLQVVVGIALIAKTWSEGAQVLYLGSWVAPYGITIVVDLLAAIMVTLCVFTALIALVFGFSELKVKDAHPLRLPLMQFLIVGVNLTFITGDLFNLFVAFEVLILASYALLTLEADDWDIREAFPYMAINLFGSALFLIACGFAYGLFGTLNYAHIAHRATEMWAAGENTTWITAFGFLITLVFAIKAGVFPLYFWLPNSYPILPIAVSAFFSGLLTKVGVYLLLRIYGTVLPHELTSVHTLLAWLGGITMILGGFGAVSRGFVRGILAFHIPSQIGYMVFAVAMFSVYAYAAAIIYMIHIIIVKSALFMVGGIMTFLCGSDDLKKCGNLWAKTPWVGIVFIVLALSLAGLPPLSGFWGKFMIIVEGLNQGYYVLVGAAISASFLTLYSMLKIFMAGFWTPNDNIELRTDSMRWKIMTACAGVMALAAVLIGVFAEFFLKLSFAAAEAALDQQGYIQAVLGGNIP